MTDRKDDEDEKAFRTAMNGVKPIPYDRIPPSRPPRPPATHRQRFAAQETIHDDISDAPEDSTLGAHDRISFAHPGVQKRVLQRLLRGQFPLTDQFDLHGLTTKEAKPLVMAFILESQGNSLRCVRMIHGKGLGSAIQKPVLKIQLNHWLRQMPEVLAFCSARPSDGGSGAINILIRKE